MQVNNIIAVLIISGHL